MKSTLIGMALAASLFATSCSKEAATDDQKIIICPQCLPPRTFIGQWKLVGDWYSIGTPGEWHNVDNGFELTIKADSTYTVSTQDDLTIGTNGRVVFRNDSTWVTNFSHGLASVLPEPNVAFHPNNDTFYMRSSRAIEGAALKFARIRTAYPGSK